MEQQPCFYLVTVATISPKTCIFDKFLSGSQLYMKNIM